MKIVIWVVLGLALFLTACGVQTEESFSSLNAIDNNIADDTVELTGRTYETLVDEQGAVSVAVTPVELSETATELRFEVALNTHSVELDMDLARLATLTTDSGQVLPAGRWEAEIGGHHVTGILSFPTTVEGSGFLANASTVILSIRDVDAAERIFTWSLDESETFSGSLSTYPSGPFIFGGSSRIGPAGIRFGKNAHLF